MKSADIFRVWLGTEAQNCSVIKQAVSGGVHSLARQNYTGQGSYVISGQNHYGGLFVYHGTRNAGCLNDGLSVVSILKAFSTFLAETFVGDRYAQDTKDNEGPHG